MQRVIRWSASAALLQGGLLFLLGWLLPGLAINSLFAALGAGVLVTAALTLTWGGVYWLGTRLHPALFPVVCFLLTGLILVAALGVIARFRPGALRIDGIGTGIVIALGLSLGNTLVGALFSLRDDAAYARFVVRPLQQFYRGTPRTERPGVLFLEIDGLAEPILREALAQGYMPTLQRWLDQGSHRLARWEPDLSSQTSASQAGILLGDNTGIPAFRWYDKPAGRLMVSSKMATARELEQRLSSGHGLLAPDGASRWNVFSGDAPDCLGTFSRVGSGGGGQRSYFAYFANPYTVARTLGLLVADVARERWQAWQQRRRDVRPRLRRTWKYAFVRAATTTLLQEASLFMLLADLFRGVPAVYTTLFAYDEVAHHSGIRSPDALKVLRPLDGMFATLERAARLAPRPYHLVILSDHGQSGGATFKQRYGQTLGALVEQLSAEDQRVAHLAAAEERPDTLGAALTESLQRDSRSARLLQRALRGRMRGDELVLDRDEQLAQAAAERRTSAADVVVLASGNLGLVSFTTFPERLTYERIVDHFPGLLEGLARHPGIACLMVHAEEEGGLVIGPGGVRYLDHGYAVGDDPLALFGPNAAAHLKRTDGFTNAPDILVLSQFDPATGEVAAFEELIGCHGGLGGPQTEPFVLYPAALPRDEAAPIVGAAALHACLKSWVLADRAAPVDIVR